MSEESPNLKLVRVRRKFPENLETHFANHTVAQFDADYFILSFFQAWPPIIMGTEEEKKEQLGQLEEIEAKCVARIVLTLDQMEDYAESVAEILENYKQRKLADATDTETE